MHKALALGAVLGFLLGLALGRLQRQAQARQHTLGQLTGDYRQFGYGLDALGDKAHIAAAATLRYAQSRVDPHPVDPRHLDGPPEYHLHGGTGDEPTIYHGHNVRLYLHPWAYGRAHPTGTPTDSSDSGNPTGQPNERKALASALFARYGNVVRGEPSVTVPSGPVTGHRQYHWWLDDADAVLAYAKRYPRG